MVCGKNRPAARVVKPSRPPVRTARGTIPANPRPKRPEAVVRKPPAAPVKPGRAASIVTGFIVLLCLVGLISCVANALDKL